MRLEVAPQAEEDLVKNADYIARDKPGAAKRWLERMYQEGQLIGRNPLLFPLERRMGLGFRQAPVG